LIDKKVTAITHVDDLIFWARDEADIHNVAMKLCELGVDLEREVDVAGFLGVMMQKDGLAGLLEMKQTGLIQRIIEAVGLDDGMVKGKYTPVEQQPLIKDADDKPPSGTFAYSTVV